MKIIDLINGVVSTVIVELLTDNDYKQITQSRYFFNWKIYKGQNVFKLRKENENNILGLMLLEDYPNEKRVEIKLITVSKENRGYGKRYEGIAGNLIAYACGEAFKKYNNDACVSLIPKDTIRQHYMTKYGMINGYRQLYLEGEPLITLIETYLL